MGAARKASSQEAQAVVMNIVVCVKQVPDSWAEKKLDPADNTLDREAADAVVNELDEFAIEEALQIQEKLGGADSLHSHRADHGTGKGARKRAQGPADGRRHGVHVVDDAMHGSDASARPRCWPSAIEQLRQSSC